MEFERFCVIFGIVAEYFGAKPSAGLTRIYFNAFDKWSIKDFEQACNNIMNSRVYNGLPKINEIKEAFYGKAEDAAAIAWQCLMDTIKNHAYWDSVIFEDGAIGLAVEAMGGWVTVSEWTIDEWRMRRKEFEAIYLANFRRGNVNPKKLTGMIEIQNGENFKEFTRVIMISNQNRVEQNVKLIN